MMQTQILPSSWILNLRLHSASLRTHGPVRKPLARLRAMPGPEARDKGRSSRLAPVPSRLSNPMKTCGATLRFSFWIAAWVDHVE